MSQSNERPAEAMDPSAAESMTGEGGSRQSGQAVAVQTRAAPEEMARRRVSTELANRFGSSEAELFNTIATNIINVKSGEPPVTRAEIFAVMTVMNRYNLDPWVKQVHAFRHQGKLNVMVGYDGWVALANRHPDFRGVTYVYSENEVKSPDGKAESWQWIEATCHREGRHPTTIVCKFREWYVPATRGDGPWQKQPSHRHRQKAYTMAVREAYGIGLMDDADYEQLQYASNTATVRSVETESSMIASLQAARGGGTPSGGSAMEKAVDAEVEPVGGPDPEAADTYSDPGGYKGDSVDDLFGGTP